MSILSLRWTVVVYSKTSNLLYFRGDMKMTNLENHRIVSKNDWLAARSALLKEEKEFTKLRDKLGRQQRDMPWLLVDKEYLFDGPNGKQTLSDLFEGRSQLIVYHFMYDPDWDAGCPSCSFWADNFNGIIVHLNQRDVTMLAVSRAPYGKIEKYKKRMGWNLKWVSSYDNDFNFDYHVSFTSEELEKNEGYYNFTIVEPDSSELPGISIFYKDHSDRIFHTYSAYSRGIDILNSAYNYLDLVPKGRDEAGQEFAQFWVRRHDEY